MADKFEAVDRISELPEFIIHHIMSFLYPKDVARTSAFSKRWNHLRASFPILIFNQTKFNKYFTFCNDSPEIQESEDKFMTFVDSSLQRFSEQRMCMQEFALFMTFDLKLASRIDKWVGLAIENNVKELRIQLQIRFDEFYHLPETVFATKSITSLEISGCILELPFGNPIKFSSLQNLYLGLVYVDDDMIRNFIHSCPLIKHLYLGCCWGFKSFRVSELFYLQNLTVSPRFDDLEEVYVEAPRLKYFAFDSIVLPNSFTINVAGTQHLKRFTISYKFITAGLLHDLISKFPNLEELKLSGSEMLERIAISSHKLKCLIITGCSKLVVAEIDAPNLLLFKYKGNKMPILSSMSALCQWEITLSVDNLNSHWFLKLREFLENLNCRKFLSLDIIYKESMFDLEELIEKSLPLPYELEHLTLRVLTRSPNSSAFTDGFMDGLFWCCHPKMISIKSGWGLNNTFIKLLCEKLMDIDVRSCCSSSQIKCWLHYLKEVAIETSEFEGTFEGTSNERFRDLLDALSTLAEGQNLNLCFRFNWCSYLI